MSFERLDFFEDSARLAKLHRVVKAEMFVAKAVLTALDILRILVEVLSGVRVSVELFQLRSFSPNFDPTFLYPLPFELQIGIKKKARPFEVVYISNR